MDQKIYPFLLLLFSFHSFLYSMYGYCIFKADIKKIVNHVPIQIITLPPSVIKNQDPIQRAQRELRASKIKHEAEVSQLKKRERDIVWGSRTDRWVLSFLAINSSILFLAKYYQS